MLRCLSALVLFSFGALWLFVASPQSHAQDGSNEPPNIVLFQFDDLSVWEYHRNPELKQATGDKGMFFWNASVSNSLCCPSRVSTLTGTHTHNHEVYRHVGPGSGFDRYRDLGLENSTIATDLDGRGYYTAHVGKYLNRYRVTDERDPGWDYWATAGTPAKDYELKENDGSVTSHAETSDRWEEHLGDRSIQAIEEWDATGPLFLQHDLHAPHTPQNYPDDLSERYSNASLPKIGAWNEPDVSDKPAYVRELPRIGDR